MHSPYLTIWKAASVIEHLAANNTETPTTPSPSSYSSRRRLLLFPLFVISVLCAMFMAFEADGVCGKICVRAPFSWFKRCSFIYAGKVNQLFCGPVLYRHGRRSLLSQVPSTCNCPSSSKFSTEIANSIYLEFPLDCSMGLGVPYIEIVNHTVVA